MEGLAKSSDNAPQLAAGFTSFGPASAHCGFGTDVCRVALNLFLEVSFLCY